MLHHEVLKVNLYHNQFQILSKKVCFVPSKISFVKTAFLLILHAFLLLWTLIQNSLRTRFYSIILTCSHYLFLNFETLHIILLMFLTSFNPSPLPPLFNTLQLLYSFASCRPFPKLSHTKEQLYPSLSLSTVL
jgi:hypothetical protein